MYRHARQNGDRPTSHWCCVELVAEIGCPLRSPPKFEFEGVRASILLPTPAPSSRIGGCYPCAQTCLALWHWGHLQSVREGRVSRQHRTLANLPEPHDSCKIRGDHNLLLLHHRRPQLRSSSLSFRHFGIRINKLREACATKVCCLNSKGRLASE